MCQEDQQSLTILVVFAELHDKTHSVDGTMCCQSNLCDNKLISAAALDAGGDSLSSSQLPVGL